MLNNAWTKKVANICDLIAQEFGYQLANYSRSKDVKANLGWIPVLIFSVWQQRVSQNDIIAPDFFLFGWWIFSNQGFGRIESLGRKFV